jgi:uridylate kinase
MYLHLKQSGELLTDPAEFVDNTYIPWTPDALYGQAARVKELHHMATEMSLEGLMLISGAGNLVRGDSLKKVFPAGSRVRYLADAAGRLGTEANAMMLSAALTDYEVPHILMTAPEMSFNDPNVQTVPYSAERVMRAYEDGDVVVVAGGSGKDDQTTDAAAMDYMLWHAKRYPQTESMVLKGTKHVDGIYTADPVTDPNAQKYAVIPATYMLSNNIGGVDRPSLELIAAAEGEAEMLVYSAQCSPLDVLRRDQAGSCIGTIITSRVMERPLLFEAAV